MKRLIVLILIALIPICGCDERTDEVGSGNNNSTSIGPLTAQLPGILIAPTGDTVQVLPGTDVILYYWLPLEKYDEMQDDLRFLASLDTSYLVLPMQPDHESRNHAQRVVNNMEISLPVYLADSAVMEMIDTDILPSCLILTHEGYEISENGFGAPSRLLIQIQSVE
ncbi:MAG: hypothetical protein GQ565_06370 [Candidatus Aegiribacteria sp.]|nr:hypothetical protein [Candidatus Aegiribacteria sp.]